MQLKSQVALQGMVRRPTRACINSFDMELVQKDTLTFLGDAVIFS